ncbi:hypothetical protein GCM10028800_08720 [Nesterenkonia populi]
MEPVGLPPLAGEEFLNTYRLYPIDTGPGRQSALGAGPSSHATMAFAAFLAGIERALTVRYHWLIDGDLGNFDVGL